MVSLQGVTSRPSRHHHRPDRGPDRSRRVNAAPEAQGMSRVPTKISSSSRSLPSIGSKVRLVHLALPD